jgi:O-antigen ligase
MEIWSPIEFGPIRDSRLHTTAFLGNPNEVGSFFVLPAIAAVSAAIAWRNLKWLYTLAAIAVAGVVAAQSITSMAALGCGLATVIFTPAARRFRRAGVAVLAVLVVAMLLHPGSRARLQRAFAFAAAGEMSLATSNRLPASAVAAEMFSERPLLGFGPGVYGALYLPYKLRIDERFPAWISIGNENFGQTHNDHLQLLAETGLPGYAIFLTALVLLARLSFRRGPAETARERFVRGFALPGAVAFFVLALGFFPMYVTATIAPAVYLAALCFAWTGADESA